jgi:hypothetical protein
MTIPLHPALFDTWEEPGTKDPWKVQLIGYIGHFPSQAAAKKFVDAVKLHRSKS